MKHSRPGPDNGEAPGLELDPELLRRGIRLNTILLAIVMGLGSGLAIFLITHVSLLVTGERAGRYLNLLGIFLPGYSASPEGAWIGLFWGFLAGALSGGFVYYMYARAIGAELASSIEDEPDGEDAIEPPTLRMAGHALGLALGLLMAAQLFLATLWLVVRGTADQSPHAALLANYFPGYTVSIPGGLLGAAYLLVVTYVFSRILASVYNLTMSFRHHPGRR